MQPILITCGHCGLTYNQAETQHLVSKSSTNLWLGCSSIKRKKEVVIDGEGTNTILLTQGDVNQ